MMDIMSKIDMQLLEEDFLEADLNDPQLYPEESRPKHSRVALISGLAAGSVAVAGVILYICRKHDVFRKAA
jgi:hypothetical protein